MINKWQAEWRGEIERIMKVRDTKIHEGQPGAHDAAYTYLTREMIMALLDGKAVSFYDGEYQHTLLLCEVEVEL